MESKIAKTVWIQASAAIIFQALTHSGALEEWFCDKAVSHPCAGGELTAQWNSGKEKSMGRAIYTRFEPNVALTLRWIDDGRGVAETATHTLNYEIAPRAGMTELVMTDHDSAEIDQETLELLAQGWNSVLLELKDYCEHQARSARKLSRHHTTE